MISHVGDEMKRVRKRGCDFPQRCGVWFFFRDPEGMSIRKSEGNVRFAAPVRRAGRVIIFEEVVVGVDVSEGNDSVGVEEGLFSPVAEIAQEKTFDDTPCEWSVWEDVCEGECTPE